MSAFSVQSNSLLPSVNKPNSSLTRKTSIDLKDDANSPLHFRYSTLSDFSKISSKGKAVRILNLSNDVLQTEPDQKISSPTIKHLRRKPKAFTSKPNVEPSKSPFAGCIFSIPTTPLITEVYPMLSPKRSSKSKTIYIQPYSPTADAKTNGTSNLGLFLSPKMDQRTFSIPSLSQIHDTERIEIPLHRNKATTQQRINMRASLKYYTAFEEINPGQKIKSTQLSPSKYSTGGYKTTQITSELKGKIASIMKEYKAIRKAPSKPGLKIWYSIGNSRSNTTERGSKM